jgi:hypothetical protein
VIRILELARVGGLTIDMNGVKLLESGKLANLARTAIGLSKILDHVLSNSGDPEFSSIQLAPGAVQDSQQLDGFHVSLYGNY